MNLANITNDDGAEQHAAIAETGNNALDADDHAQNDTASKRPSKEERDIILAEKRSLEQQERAEKKAKRTEETTERKKDFMEKKRALSQNKIADTAKRFEYLLGQTDLFSHFIDMKKSKDPEFAALIEETEKLTKSTKSTGKKAGASRRRKTEQEEDAELLADANRAKEGEIVFTESPSYVKGGTMRDYQVQGLNWMISLYHNGINGILADEMGLGKTLQSISFLGYLKHYQQIKGPHLVIVPKSTLHNWVKEFNKWVPDLDVFSLHGDKDQRAAIIKDTLLTNKFDICVTSYEMCLIEKSHMKKFAWQYIIIDEAHRIKNENSLLSQIVRFFDSKNRMLITGTPLQNNLHELWALLNFLLPDVFSSAEDFDSWFEVQGGNQDTVVAQLHKVLRPFLLRRIKADVEKSLLPKKEINLYVGMSSMQRKWYQKILEKDIDAVNGAGGKKESKTRLLNIVMQLRKCCNHPYLFDGAEPGPPYTTDQHLVDNAGKMIILDRLLTRLKAQGSRVLIFSQMSRVLDILEDYCNWKGHEYCRLDGSTNHEDRVQMIDDYNAPDSSKFVFLLTTRAGGLGINLVTADIVVIFDSDWNPQADLQAMDRAHRIGQTKQVYVFRFITENGIEEQVLERAAQKLRLDQLVIQQGRQTPASKASNKEDLLSMIQHGAESVFKSTDSTVSNEDIDSILKRGEEKTRELATKYENIGIDDLAKFSSDGSSAYEWEGEVWNSKRKGAIGLNWIQPAKRERKANYAVDDYYRDAMRTGSKGQAAKAPKPPKQATCHDFQFFPPRIFELQEKEVLAYRKSINYQVVKRAEDEEGADDAEREREEEQKKIDESEALTEKEIAEKEELLERGFVSWSKKDFQTFVKGCGRYGRKDLDSIAKDLDKGLKEVKQYSEVFWQRYTEIEDYEKLIASIEQGEEKLRKVVEVQQILTDKVDQYKFPLQQLRISYGTNKGKNYSEENDRFLVVALEQYGYGSDDVYEHVRQEVLKADAFRFDWFIKSRTAAELARRCQTLISLVQKEFAEIEEKEKEEKKIQRKNAAASKKSKPATPTGKGKRR